MQKSNELGMSICSTKTGLILVGVYVVDKNMAGKKAESESHVEEIDEMGCSGRTDIVS